MKNVIILIVVILFIFSCSDRMDEVVEYRFEINNNSGKDIKITSYDHEQLRIVKKIINIDNGNSYQESFFSRQSEETYNFLDVFNGDSIVINYDDQKKQTYYCYKFFTNDEIGCDEPRNILSYLKPVKLDSKNNISFFQYSFTEEDYQNAIPCEGECE